MSDIMIFLFCLISFGAGYLMSSINSYLARTESEEEEDKELADEGLFLSEEVLDKEEEDEIQRQEDEFVTELSAHLEGDEEP